VARLAGSNSLRVADLAGQVDFALAFAVVHELPSPASFFIEFTGTLKPGAGVLLRSPWDTSETAQFQAELRAAAEARLESVEHPSIRRSCAVLLRKAGAEPRVGWPMKSLELRLRETCGEGSSRFGGKSATSLA
jgi:hypothetical protein